MKVKLEKLSTPGENFEKNPTWHVEESPWKSKQILRILARSGIKPETICEVGCGVGEVLKQLQRKMDSACTFWGYGLLVLAK
jgi:hypothetical protein